jgi:cytochrome P450
VTRYDDVAEVLSRHDVFAVPFAEEIARLNDGGKAGTGTPFILGIDNVKSHDEQLRRVMHIFSRSDVKATVSRLCRDIAERSVAASSGVGFDAIRNLITHVPLEVCRSYYGIDIDDPERFAHATFRVSGHLFGCASVTAAQAGKADRKDDGKSINDHADYVRGIVNTAIDQGIRTEGAGETVVAKMVRQHLLHPEPAHPEHYSREEMRAFLLGMIIGFVPTNTLAGGHILDMLLRKKAFVEEATSAATVGDDDLLQRCLFEAMRFKPHNFGPFRICKRDYVVAAGTRHRAEVKAGTKVWALTMSAMFDPRKVDRPYDFIPSRPASDSMLLGYGMHWCAGAFIARAQITQTFKALLVRPELQRAEGASGKLHCDGGFPDHLLVDFRPVKS